MIKCIIPILLLISNVCFSQTFDFKVLEGEINGRKAVYFDLENYFKGKVKVEEIDFLTSNKAIYEIDFKNNQSLIFYKKVLDTNQAPRLIRIISDECRATIVLNKSKAISSEIVCRESL